MGAHLSSLLLLVLGDDEQQGTQSSHQAMGSLGQRFWIRRRSCIRIAINGKEYVLNSQQRRGSKSELELTPFLPSFLCSSSALFLSTLQVPSSTNFSVPASMSWTRRLVNRPPRVRRFSIFLRCPEEIKLIRRSHVLSSQESGCAKPRSILSWSWM